MKDPEKKVKNEEEAGNPSMFSSLLTADQHFLRTHIQPASQSLHNS